MTLVVNEQVPRLMSAILPFTDLETSLGSQASSFRVVLFVFAIAKDPFMNLLLLSPEGYASKNSVNLKKSEFRSCINYQLIHQFQ